MRLADPEGTGEFRAVNGRANTAQIPREFRLKTAADVLSLLDEQVRIVRADGPRRRLEEARSVCALASVALRAIETGDLAARIEMLEAVLKQRDARTK